MWQKIRPVAINLFPFPPFFFFFFNKSASPLQTFLWALSPMDMCNIPYRFGKHSVFRDSLARDKSAERETAMILRVSSDAVIEIRSVIRVYYFRFWFYSLYYRDQHQQEVFIPEPVFQDYFSMPALFMSKGRGFHTPLFPTGCSICAGCAAAAAAIRWATFYCIYVWL